MSVGVEAALQKHDSSHVRVVLMHDAEGKVLVLVPAAKLLNLSYVWKVSGRQLQPVRGDDARRFFGQAGLEEKGAFRNLSSLPLLVDSDCMQLPVLQVHEPHSQRLWQVESRSLKPVASDRLSISFADIQAGVPLGGDEEVISCAVQKFTQLRVKQRLEDTLDLPAMSQTHQKILQLRADPEAEVEDLVEVVRLDPSLSAQVMSWAASPYYAAPGKVSSIEDAVVRVLGFELVVNMALGMAMGKMLTVPKNGPREGTPYWLEAVYCATLAEQLCHAMPQEKRPKPGLAYLGGLLHNFGYLLLAHLFPSQFAVLSRYIEANPHFSLEAVEQQVINVTREQIGAWLLSSWKLPPEVYEAIRHQNQPGMEGECGVYSDLLFVATRMLRQKGLSDGPVEELPDGLLASLGLKQEMADKLLRKLVANDEALRDLTRLLVPGSV